MTPVQLAQAITNLKQAQAYQRGAWVKVQECGRQWAMVKAHGCYVERGNRISLSKRDQESYEEMFRENLLRAVQDAFIEDAITGQTFDENANG